MSSLKAAAPQACLCLLVALLALVGCSKQQAAPQGSAAIPVTVVTLKTEAVTLLRELPGRSSAYLVAEVRPQVNGIIARRLFTEGGMVKAGQPLYQLDDATYRADAESAQANLSRAQATLVTAELNARRSADLVKIDAVSKQDDENASAALRQAEADVRAARAAAERAKTFLDYARISSPISGRIGKSNVTQGALVTANQDDALTTVQQLDPMYVDVTQSSAEFLELRRALAAGDLKGTRDLPVTILLEDGSALRACWQAGLFRRHGRSVDRQFRAACRRAQSGQHAVARDVRARPRRRRRTAERAARTATGRRSRPERKSDGDGRRSGRQGGGAAAQGEPCGRRQMARRGRSRRGR